ncbi:AzlC family ABC transporter permease [Corynebacterium tuscaniense]|uniref:AzlC family ABC transporter permease n=1 Tax=Corynebacterium tuscaniense TaxID=302449 RepID=UPI00123A8E24|nr:AzlC family ABC transporter permease [Corynebacterium tuscaniense]KAA8739475.1 AzlC family ABC transporter permease [Corynebacterium tuscaniense]
MTTNSQIRSEIRGGIRDTWLVGLGLIPLGLAFGLVMVQAGFAWWWTPIFSIIIYAGSMEFLAVQLVTTGVGPLSAAITGFMVNFRHIFYGLTFPRHLISSPLGRAYSTYALTDESYAITSSRPPTAPNSGARVLTIQILCQLMWVLPGIVGALLGAAIPSSVIGVDYALTALFIVLAYEAFRANPDFSLPLTATVIAALLAVLAPSWLLMAGLSAYFLVLILRYARPGVDRALELRASRLSSGGEK